MATIIVTNDPTTITAAPPGTTILIAETFQDSNPKIVTTLLDAQAVTKNGTLIYVEELDVFYVKGQTGLRPIVMSEN